MKKAFKNLGVKLEFFIIVSFLTIALIQISKITGLFDYVAKI